MILANPRPSSKPGLRYPALVQLRAPKVRTRALSPFERANRIFRDRLAPLGCKIEFGPAEECGVFINLPSVGLSDYGRTLEDAIQNFVEKAQEVASMKKVHGESWTKELEAQHRLMKKALG